MDKVNPLSIGVRSADGKTLLQQQVATCFDCKLEYEKGAEPASSTQIVSIHAANLVGGEIRIHALPEACSPQAPGQSIKIHNLWDSPRSDDLTCNLTDQADVLIAESTQAESLSDTTLVNIQSIPPTLRAIANQGFKSVVITGIELKDAPGLYFDACLNRLESWIWQYPAASQTSRSNGHVVFCIAAAAMLTHDYVLEDAGIVARAFATRYSANESLAGLSWPDNLKDFPRLVDERNAINQPSLPAPPDSHEKQLGFYPLVPNSDWVKKLLNLGVKTIQLRVKEQPLDVLEREISQSISITSQYGARLFINDHWQLAIKHKAYGVHLGQEDIAQASIADIKKAGLRLGVSTHGYAEILRVLPYQPDYVALGAVYAPVSKQVATKPLGLEKLRRYAKLLEKYPLVAIGGITLENAAQVLRQGVGGVSVISSITQADDPGSTVAMFLTLFQSNFASQE